MLTRDASFKYIMFHTRRAIAISRRTSNRMHTSHDAFAIARDLMRRKEYSEAVAVISEALTQTPENPMLLGLLSEIYLKSGNTEEAEKWNNKVLAFNPSDYFALQRKADLLAKRKEYDEALSIFENLIATSGGNPFLYRRIAKVHQLQKNSQKAIEVLRNAIEQFPDRADLHYQAFTVYREAGIRNEALTSISEAARLEPDNQLFRTMKMSLRAENENADTLEEVVELSGESDPQLLKILARKLKKEGNIEKAIEIFKKVVALEDSDFSRKELGFAYYHNRDFSRAFSLFMSLGDDAFSDAPFVNAIVTAAKTKEEKEALIERLARIAASGKKSLWGKVTKLKKELSQNKDEDNP